MCNLQAAGFIRPLVSTVVTKDKESLLEDVFDRSQCHGSEMPQAFKYEHIKEAYECVSYIRYDININYPLVGSM